MFSAMGSSPCLKIIIQGIDVGARWESFRILVILYTQTHRAGFAGGGGFVRIGYAAIQVVAQFVLLSRAVRIM